MINHRCPKLSEWSYNSGEGGYVLNAFDRIEEGVELFDSYGKKCNSRFFINYGFLEQSEESHEYVFSLALAAGSVPGYEEKVRVHEYLQHVQKLRLVCSMDYEEETVIKGMRFWVAEGEKEMKAWKEFVETRGKEWTDKVLADQTGPISVENEVRALGAVKELCRLKLEAYPTSRRQDEELLKKGGMSYSQRICVEYRLGEKVLLENTMRMVESVVPLFKQSIGEVIMRLGHFPLKKYEEYVRTCLIPLLHREQLTSHPL